MNVIETFGAKVGELTDKDPRKARRLLTTGFRANGIKNACFPGGVTKSDQMIFRAVNNTMIRCLAHPENNVMVSLFTPCEMLHTLGLNPYSCEGFSGYLSGSMVERHFLQAAEESGIPNSLCSYHKVFIGAAQTGLMPKPKFIVSTSLACDANMLTFRHLADWYDVPHFSIDVPMETSRQAVEDVAGQLRKLGEFLTANTGRPIDENQLVQAVARSHRTLSLYDRCLTKRKGKLVLSDMTSELFRTVCFHFLLGLEDTERYARQLAREIEAAPPAEGVQLLWIHTTPYWVPALRQLFTRNPRVQIVACDMNYEGIIPDTDPTKPYEAMAKRLVYSSFNGPISRRIQRSREVAKQVGADGAVWFCHWGCKHTLGGARLGKEALEADGVPTLILDGDSCDRGFGGEGQATTRMEAFLEVLEGIS